MHTSELKTKMHGERKVLSVKVPDNGSLKVWLLHDDKETTGTDEDWNLVEEYTVSGAYEFYFGVATVKITPAGGATFSIL